MKAQCRLQAGQPHRRSRKRYPGKPQGCGKTGQVQSVVSRSSSNAADRKHKRSTKACCLHKLSSDQGRGCAVSKALFSVQQAAVAHPAPHLPVVTACGCEQGEILPSPCPLTLNLDCVSLSPVFCLSQVENFEMTLGLGLRSCRVEVQPGNTCH